tara:strand:- start:470 stop:709 length:240 start_codon:yes stop_codon:yes gene_type:complete
MKLIHKIKPEALEAFEKMRIKYSSSYRCIMISLNNADRYAELTIDEINTITCFLPNELKPKTSIGWMYGDNILLKKYRL